MGNFEFRAPNHQRTNKNLFGILVVDILFVFTFYILSLILFVFIILFFGIFERYLEATDPKNLKIAHFTRSNFYISKVNEGFHLGLLK